MRLLHRVLRVRADEAGTAWRLLGLMLVLWAGLTVGGAAVESLYLARFGPRGLPLLYLALGPLTLAAMGAMGALLGRRDPRPVLVGAYPAVAAAVLLAWGAVRLGSGWVYPALWLAMMVLWTVAAFAAWGLAGLVHDTRQAKRLFPLYGAGLILGGALGGVATRPLADLIHAENLLLVWAGGLVAVWWLAAGLARRAPRTVRVAAATGPPWRELAAGLRAVRGSRLLGSMASALALFSLLYFALAFLFARAATARYPAADDLAGFLGTFAGATNLAALLVSLLATNRLFARFGIVWMILVLPLVYLAGFSVLAAASAFGLVVAFRAVQVVWVNGVWATGWQALFNVVPAERRSQVRVFMDGVPLQAGIVASGALLLIADRLLGPREVALVGVAAALVAVGAMWRARRSYVAALVEALRSGNPEVFVAEEEPFAGFARDRAARRAVLEGAGDPDPAVRRVSVEILGAMGGRGVRSSIERALRDPEAAVRLAGLTAVGGLPGRPAAETLLPLARDPDPGVRAAGASALSGDDGSGPHFEAALRDLLDDPEPPVRIAAAAGLAARDPERLRAMLTSGEPAERAAVLAHLGRSLTAGGPMDGDEAAATLTGALADPDPAVREAAADAWAGLGASEVDRLVAALEDPATEEAALRALIRIGPPDVPGLREYARARAREAAADGRLWRALEASPGEEAALLADALRHRCFARGLGALRATAGEDAARRVVLENVLSREPDQRANALEVMDAAADRDVVGPLLAVWDEASPPPDPVLALGVVLEDRDPLIRAFGVLAAGRGAPELGATIGRLSREDPDPLVRETATLLAGGDDMETLATVPLLQRVVALRRVPLFAELDPADVKQVAEVATEHTYPGGAVIAEQGEPGEQMLVVLSGAIRVVRGSEEIARRGPGQYVGEMSVITGAPRMASLVAEGDVRALALDRPRFERILRERPAAGLAVMRTLCERLEESHRGGVPA